MNFKTAAFLAASLMTVPSVAMAQFNFNPADAYPVGTEPSDVAIGDFNGDNIADIATTIDNPDRIVILLGNGGGTFTLGPSINLGSNASAQDLVAGDLDGDNDIDLAVGLKGPNQVRIYLNQGGANFVAGASYPTGQEPRGMDIGDHDGDNDLDICVANRDSNNVTVLTNAGNGTFAAVTLPAGAEPRGAAFGDFDGDGDLDMAVSNHDARSISLYTNNGGVFTAAGTISVGSQRRPEGIVSADLNGDGLDDIAAASNGNAFNSATVFLAVGGGAFSGATHYPTGGADTSSITAADFNCDNVIDLALSSQDSNNVSVLANQGGGTFGAATLLATGASPDNLTSGDLDGDGVADIAVANQSSGTVTVHINETCDGGGQYTLALSGTCPGRITVAWSGASSNATQAIVFGQSLGSTTIPNGMPCAGTVLGIQGGVQMVSPPGFFSTGSGSGQISGNAGQGACGNFLQLVEGGTCQTSNVAQIP